MLKIWISCSASHTKLLAAFRSQECCGGVYNDGVEVIDGCENYLYTCMWETAVTANQAVFLQQTSGVLSSAIFSSTDKHSLILMRIYHRIGPLSALIGCWGADLYVDNRSDSKINSPPFTISVDPPSLSQQLQVYWECYLGGQQLPSL